MTDPNFDFGHYMHAQTKVEAASNDSERAGYKLNLEQIRMRAAELRSQHEPLESLINGCFKGPACAEPEAVRSAMLDAIFYVVQGRFPEKTKKDPTS